MSQALAKTQSISVLAWQDIASAAMAISSAQSVATKFAATFFIKVARLTGSAFTAGSPNIRIEGSASTTVGWIPLATFQPAIGATIAATTLNGAVSAGASSFVVTSATNIAAGALLFLGHTTLPANYELVRVKSVSGTTITPEEPVVNAHDTGALVTSQAEEYVAQIDCTAIYNLRAVADNISSGQGIKVEVLMTTGDSIG